MHGTFITLEGIDGAGKSSHIEPLAKLLRGQGYTVNVTRELGGTPLAEVLRTMVLHQPMDALTEVLLSFAARRDHLQRVIVPALARGEVVLCDRFTDSTYAYQGRGRGVPTAVIGGLEGVVQQGVEPDLTLWFDLPVEEAVRRRSAARSPDRFEAEEEAFFARVRSGYLARQELDPDRIHRVDALPPISEVWGRVAEIVASHFRRLEAERNRLAAAPHTVP